MSRVLRAITGLPPDTTVIVDRRVTLGRAPDSDLQLSDPEVSRRHAKIEIDPDGRVMLVDLASTTGTFVRGARIDRHELAPGDELIIGRFRLRYDEVDEDVAEQRPPPQRNMEVLRQTTRLEMGRAGPRVVGTPPPPPPRSVDPRVDPVGAPAMTLREDTAQIVLPTVPRLASTVMPRAPRGSIAVATAFDEPVASGIPQPIDEHDELLLDADDSAARALPGVERDPLEVRAESMSHVRTVFEYRWLRLAQLHHQILDHEELARLDELERLTGGDRVTARGDAEAVSRTRRLGCAVPAWIVRFDGQQLLATAAALEAVGPIGAQLRLTDMPRPDERCWLVVDLEDEHSHPFVVFGARVVWALPVEHELGVMFVGNVASGTDAMALVRADAGLG